MTTADHSTEARLRVRRHMLTSLAGVLALFVGAGVAGALGKLLDHGPLRQIIVLGVLLPSLTAPVVVGLWSARRNLRCPGCDGSFLSMRRRSPWSERTSGHCPGCGALLFTTRAPTLPARSFAVGIGAAIAVLTLMGALAFVLSKSR